MNLPSPRFLAKSNFKSLHLKRIAESEIELDVWGVLEDHVKVISESVKDKKLFICGQMRVR